MIYAVDLSTLNELRMLYITLHSYFTDIPVSVACLSWQASWLGNNAPNCAWLLSQLDLYLCLCYTSQVVICIVTLNRIMFLLIAVQTPVSSFDAK